MYQNLLPIGSVVLLKGGEKRIMICGRVITQDGGDEIFDYMACYYPEGIVDPSNMFFFNGDAIESVYFIGFQDPEELNFRAEVLGKLGKLKVENGQIVSDD